MPYPLTLSYPICLLEQDCLAKDTKCFSGICLSICSSKCKQHEYCDRSKNICIPRLLRRKFSKECDKYSCCYLHETCVSGKCVRNNKVKLPCTNQIDCGGGNAACYLGFCQEVYQKVCTQNSQCSKGFVCVENECASACALDGTCRNGGDKKSCDSYRDCNKGEYCHDNVCTVSVGDFCLNDDDCSSGKVCQYNKCGLPQDKVLPSNFLCECKENENCDIKDCFKSKVSSESELIPTKSKDKTQTIETLKHMIQELIKAEEKQLVPPEVIEESRLGKNQLLKMKIGESLSNKINSNQEDTPSPSFKRHGTVQKTCIVNNECIYPESCCVLGVCMNLSPCSQQSNFKRQMFNIRELADMNIACRNQDDCPVNMTCDLGLCQRDSSKRERQLEKECDHDSDCKELHRTCLIGACVETLDLDNTNSNGKVTEPCIYDSDGNNGVCENQELSCFMNACV